MVMFCFLWMPLFYLFWRSITRLETESAGGIWALILGSVAAFIQFYLGVFINPGAFGLSRWFSACIDIVALPALLPLLAGALLSRLRILKWSAPSGPNYANFALLWLIPVSAIRGVSGGAQNGPSLPVVTLVLWTAIVVGIPAFIKIIFTGQFMWRHIPAAIAMTALPFLAATAYWAFFSQKTGLGFLLLALTLIPAFLSVTVSYYRSCVKS
jgi:hypothetical protein